MTTKQPATMTPDLHPGMRLYYEDGNARIDIVKMTGRLRCNIEAGRVIETEAVVPGVPRYGRVVWIRPEQLRIY